MRSFTESIAAYIQEMSWAKITREAKEAGLRSIIDCLGVALAGQREEASRILSHYADYSRQQEAGVIGGGFKTTAELAAWINGTQSHALDYDDYFSLGGSTPYHPTTVILPAVLAVAEEVHAPGQDVLLAYITGFEVEATLAAICARRQYDLGWHTTSTLGSPGAAAAVAKLLKLDRNEIRMALGIASSLSSGLRKNFGTMTKPLHAGNGARNGVIAARLAQQGFTADNNILDNPLGFDEVLTGGTEPEVDKATMEDREGFYIVAPGAALKPYPSCAYTHWAIDAALKIRNEVRFVPGEIVEVECHTSSALPNLLIHSRPTTPLEGKFSLEYCVAIALLDNVVSLKQFTVERVNDTAVQALLRKVKYVHPVEFGSGLTNLRGKVVVKLGSGQTCSQEVNKAKGSPENPLTTEAIMSKYRDCARLALSPGNVEKSLELLLSLASVKDIVELTDILTFGTGAKTRNKTRRTTPSSKQ
ncbi:MAG: MmgE/PrpD family protein [Chloroflexota bacterium]